MVRNKKSDSINQPNDTNNHSTDLPIENISRLEPEPSKSELELFNQVIQTIDEMLPNGLLQSESEKVQNYFKSFLLNSVHSYTNMNIPANLLIDDYVHYFSNKIKSLKNLKTSASAIEDLLKEEVHSKDEIEKEVNKLKKAKDDNEEVNRNFAIASRISAKGLQYLKNNPDLYRKFDGNFYNTTVVSIDIRSSTQLMLNAKSPNDFVAFISDLSISLSTLVKESFGIYDKFTGDGLLCFFPSFYSGEDHVYLALLLADSCHKLFQKIYAKHHNKFSVVRSDIGLGIGIDIGDTYLTFVNYEPTVIGTAVVYACRLSGAPSNTTYINQQVYEAVMDKYEENFVLTPCEIDFKGQGKMRVYKCVSSKELNPIPLPEWAIGEMKETSESKEKV